MKTSLNGRALIERYEGLILQSYDDANDKIVKSGEQSRGTLTIGYGHTSAAGAPTVHPGMVITKAQADSILASDLTKIEADVSKLVKVKLNQNQFDALVSFHFNTGSLGRSSALRLLNQGKYQEAADALMYYTKGRVDGQLVPMRGLITRRTAEKALFLKKPVITGNTVQDTAVVTTVGGVAATVYQYAQTHWLAITAVAVAGLIAYGIFRMKKETNVE